MSDPRDRDERSIPLAEEALRVGKRTAPKDRVRVRTEVRQEAVPVALDLQHDEVEVERVHIDEEVSEVPQVRVVGDVTIIPVLEEVLVVERRLILKEEVRIRRRVTTEPVEAVVPVRRMVAVVERDRPDNGAELGEDPVSESAAMTRTLTAFFDDKDAAEKAKDELKTLGVPGNDIDIHHAGDDRSDGRGFMDKLADFFVPADDSRRYAEGVSRGGYLLTARVDETYYDRAHEALERSGAVDFDEREREWDNSGGERSATPAASGDEATGRPVEAGGRYTGEERSIPLVEERLRVGKRDVERGSTRVRSYIIETPVEEQINLREEHVRVERRPVDAPVDNPEALLREQEISMTEYAEEPVVQKEARVREEVVLRKEADERTQRVSDTVRRTEVDVEGAGERRSFTGLDGDGSPDSLSEEERLERERVAREGGRTTGAPPALP